MSYRTDASPLATAPAPNRLKFVLHAGHVQQCAPTECVDEEDWTEDDERLVQELMNKAQHSQRFPESLSDPAEQPRQDASKAMVRRLEQHFQLAAPTRVAYTRLGGPERERIEAEKAKVAQYMPTLADLQAACLAVHQVFLYIDKFPDVSDAWALSWRAGDVNYIPWNHFETINFMESNEAMVNKAIEVIAVIAPKMHAQMLTQEEESFMKAWVLAHQMVARIRELNANARYWSQMREEYGEWAAARVQ